MEGKKIVLGITGSIAAYKAAVLTRALIKKGAEVQIVITPAGKEFITPITLSALTSKPVISEFFAQRDGTWHSHVDLGLWADAMLIAPATASTIGKMAHGIADNMLVTTYLSMKAPVFVAPAMDLDMFAHPSTQHNLNILRSYGNHIIEPASGELASHLTGKGRMEEPEKIVEVLENFFAQSQRLAGKKILITAGPTYEKIDPVRFIGNYSSGKMGYALAESCAESGAEVILISGPVSLSTRHPAIRRIDVESAEEMYKAATEFYPACDAGILCAAVADFTPETVAPNASITSQATKGRRTYAAEREACPEGGRAAANRRGTGRRSCHSLRRVSRKDRPGFRAVAGRVREDFRKRGGRLPAAREAAGGRSLQTLSWRGAPVAGYADGVGPDITAARPAG